MERIQRVLASRGVASRRKAEELIVQGRVRIDGKVVTELGARVDPERQKIEVDGKLLPIFRHRYILLNKPSGYITTTSDERDRRTVMDLVQVSEPVVPVGRLDRPTEGLLLLTNDGEVANRVAHPRYEIEKEYEALLDGHPPPGILERVRRGIVVDGERATPSVVRPLRNLDEGTLVRIVIHEGRNRIVRRMFEEVGYPVLKLVRTRIGPLQLGTIPKGTWRELTDGELEQLREALHLGDEDTRRPERPERPAPARGRAPAGTGRPTWSRASEGEPRARRDDRQPVRASESNERTQRPARATPAQGQDRSARSGPDGERAAPSGRPAWKRAAPTERSRRPDDRQRAERTADRRDGGGRPGGAPPGRPAAGESGHTRRADRKPGGTPTGTRSDSRRPGPVPARSGRPERPGGSRDAGSTDRPRGGRRTGSAPDERRAGFQRPDRGPRSGKTPNSRPPGGPRTGDRPRRRPTDDEAANRVHDSDRRPGGGGEEHDR